jgi:hypothetical protein
LKQPLDRGRRHQQDSLVDTESIITPRKKHSVTWTGFIVWPFVILILYVLSYGPVTTLVDKGRISVPNVPLATFYMPLQWAYERTPFEKPLGMYMHLWSPKYFDKNGMLLYGYLPVYGHPPVY